MFFVLVVCLSFLLDGCWLVDASDTYPSSRVPQRPPRLTGDRRECSGRALNIDCGSGNNISVRSTSFGPQSQHETCRQSTKASQIVEENCSGKSSCSIPTTADAFSMTECRGLTMCLDVSYICESAVPPVTSRPMHYTPTPTTSYPPIWSADWLRSTKKSSTTHRSPADECPHRNSKRVSWPRTSAGQKVFKECPNNLNLRKATWYCGTDPVKWVGEPDLTQCVSASVSDLKSQLGKTKDAKGVAKLADQLVEVSTGKQLLSGGDLDGIVSIMQALVIELDVHLKNETQSLDGTDAVSRVTEAMVNTSSNLLNNSAVELWESIPSDDWSGIASKLMSAVEDCAFQSTKTSKQQQSVAHNVLLETFVSDSPSTTDVVFPKSLQRKDWKGQNNTFRLPHSVLSPLSDKDHRVPVVFVSYNNLDQWLPQRLNATLDSADISNCSQEFDGNSTAGVDCREFINTDIVSVSVGSTEQLTSLLSDPVVFTLQHKQPTTNKTAHCVYWIPPSNSSLGEWSTDGCEVVASNATHTTCQCTHLTSFAIIMSPTAPKLSATHELVLSTITYIGCIISIVCLVLAFITFQAFRNLANDRNTIHKNLVACLAVANIIFLAGIAQYSDKVLCAVVAGFLHYFFLASFAWMCLEGFQLYVLLVEVFEAKKSRVGWYYAAGYGFPAIVVIISAAVYHEGYGTTQYCWLTTERGFVWAFIGPVIVILLVNIVMLVVAVRAMYRYTTSSAAWLAKDKTRLKQIGSWLKGAVTLLVLLGLTWAFGLGFVSEQTVAFAYIFTILNSLQGMFIFIFHCLMNDKVRTEYKRCLRRCTCLPENCRNKLGYEGPTAALSNGSRPAQQLTNDHSKVRRKSTNSTTMSQSTTSDKHKPLLEKHLQSMSMSDSVDPGTATGDTDGQLELSDIRVEQEIKDDGENVTGIKVLIDTDHKDSESQGDQP